MNKKRFLLIVGHNQIQKGEYSPVLGQQEWTYWRNIAEQIVAKNSDNEAIDIDIAIRNYRQSYKKEMQEILSKIRNSGIEYDCIFELHFNGVKDKSVGGAECLVYHKSVSHEIAKHLLNELHKDFGVKNRGLKYIHTPDERGGYGICKSKHPYILIEPFFGTNDKESSKFIDENKVSNFFMKFLKEI